MLSKEENIFFFLHLCMHLYGTLNSTNMIPNSRYIIPSFYCIFGSYKKNEYINQITMWETQTVATSNPFNRLMLFIVV